MFFRISFLHIPHHQSIDHFQRFIPVGFHLVIKVRINRYYFFQTDFRFRDKSITIDRKIENKSTDIYAIKK